MGRRRREGKGNALIENTKRKKHNTWSVIKNKNAERSIELYAFRVKY
jgi:hypothetical protein